MKNKNSQRLLDLINSAIALANSVKDDIEERGLVSDETVLALTRFSARQDDCKEMLSVVEQTLVYQDSHDGSH